MTKKNNKNNKKRKSEANAAQSLQTSTTPPATTSSKKNIRKNPLWQAQKQFLSSLTEVERDSFFSASAVDPERRGELWMEQADFGENLINKYSWSTPDERALRILKEFSPIIEIGCGSNAYWCQSMAAAGMDVVGYDISVTQGGQIIHQEEKKKKKKKDSQSRSSSNNNNNDFVVRRGGPQVLASKENSNRTLFLCYPDEEDSKEAEQQHGQVGENSSSSTPTMGAACLEHYQGQYIIHVGELYGDTLSLDQAPWGRSSGSEFQERLASEYHCILKASLQNWLHVRDTISVWKRSERCSIVFAAEDDDDDDDEDEEVEYVHIPVTERLPVDLAAPCMQHLLTTSPPEVEANVSNREIPVSPDEESNDAKTATTSMKAKSKRKRGKESQQEAVSTIDRLQEDGKKSDDYVCPW